MSPEKKRERIKKISQTNKKNPNKRRYKDMTPEQKKKHILASRRYVEKMSPEEKEKLLTRVSKQMREKKGTTVDSGKRQKRKWMYDGEKLVPVLSEEDVAKAGGRHLTDGLSRESPALYYKLWKEAMAKEKIGTVVKRKKKVMKKKKESSPPKKPLTREEALKAYRKKALEKERARVKKQLK